MTTYKPKTRKVRALTSEELTSLLKKTNAPALSQKGKALALASLLGVTVEVQEGARTALAAEVRQGFRFACSGTHGLVVEALEGRPLSDTWKELRRELSQGLEPCASVTSCEICAEVAA